MLRARTPALHLTSVSYAIKVKFWPFSEDRQQPFSEDTSHRLSASKKPTFQPMRVKLNVVQS